MNKEKFNTEILNSENLTSKILKCEIWKHDNLNNERAVKARTRRDEQDRTVGD